MTGFVTRPGVILAASVVLLMAVILAHIAVTADAYVTFRVVDNFVHGYGLRWNVIDRVQVYTHPLWMLLHIPLYALGINIFHVTAALSFLCTLGAVLLAIHTLRKPWLETIALFIAPLLVSQSFVFSSMNGLENPLEHFLFALFGWALLRPQQKYFWFWLSFSCALSLTTRLDTILLYAPVILYAIVTRFHSIRIRECLLGALPFIGWELFSLFYYGFLFPNTAYAKLEGIANIDAIDQGFHYLLNLLALDITSAGFLWAAILLPAYRWLMPEGKTIRPEMVFLSLGVLLYTLYVIDIGGTFLSGRFWSLPVFASVWLLYGVAGDRVGKRFCLCLAAALLAVKLVYPEPGALRKTCPACFAGGISPGYYSVFPDGYYSDKVHRPLPVAGHGGQPWVVVFSGVGMFAFETGPRLVAVNPYAFTDPLLARLPNTGIPLTRSVNNHWLRDVPAGYVYALQTGSLEKMDPPLAEYYGKLRMIISGDLWDWQRIGEIFRFNRGDYDYLVEQYASDKKGN